MTGAAYKRLVYDMAGWPIPVTSMVEQVRPPGPRGTGRAQKRDSSAENALGSPARSGLSLQGGQPELNHPEVGLDQDLLLPA